MRYSARVKISVGGPSDGGKRIIAVVERGSKLKVNESFSQNGQKEIGQHI